MQSDSAHRYLFAHSSTYLDDLDIEASPLMDTWAVNMITRYLKEQPGVDEWNEFMSTLSADESSLKMLGPPFLSFCLFVLTRRRIGLGPISQMNAPEPYSQRDIASVLGRLDLPRAVLHTPRVTRFP